MAALAGSRAKAFWAAISAAGSSRSCADHSWRMAASLPTARAAASSMRAAPVRKARRMSLLSTRLSNSWRHDSEYSAHAMTVYRYRPGSGGVNSAVQTSFPARRMSISWSGLDDARFFQRSTTRILSWPSVKQCASTATGSPAMRLAGNRPPSTRGRTASMTARPLPPAMPTGASGPGAGAGAGVGVFLAGALRLALATGFPAQDEGRQRRQIEVDRLNAAVRTHGYGFDAAQIAPAGP